jgi:hypothetical protein
MEEEGRREEGWEERKRETVHSIKKWRRVIDYCLYSDFTANLVNMI